MRLEPTSERVIEDAYMKSDAAYLVYIFHLATYRYATKFAVRKRVLDLGCGSGYGTATLARTAANVTGVDVAPDAVEYASSHYAHDKVKFLRIDPGQPLPFPAASFDLITSFQVIEHVSDVSSYLREIKRVLAPGGLFIVATPDRSVRLFPFQKPWNAWHLTEYDADGLCSVLKEEFPDVLIEKMGGPRDLVDIELDRYRRMRFLSLPFTLPFVPERLRQAVLRAFSRKRLRSMGTGLTERVASFQVEDVMIGPQVHPSINVLGLARH